VLVVWIKSALFSFRASFVLLSKIDIRSSTSPVVLEISGGYGHR
jgi:hypothetical protein